MINNEELALAIARKYLELEELAGKVGAYRAMRMDWARYGGELDEVLEALRDGLECFDRELSGALSEGECVKGALERTMDEQGMDEARRARFLSVARTFVEQAGAQRLMAALDGESANVLRALIRVSETGAPDDDTRSAAESMEAICRAAELSRERAPLSGLDGEEAEDLMRCYAAYCVLRDGGVPGAQLSGDCLKFIGASVRAGRAQAGALRAGQEGQMSGARVAEVLRAVAEVLLIALALALSGAAGVCAGMSVAGLAVMLLGVNGALGQVALALGIIGGVPAGLKVACEALKACAQAGMWLEQNALEPGAARLAEWLDGVAQLVERSAPEFKQGVDNACGRARRAADAARQGALDWFERTGGELDAALGRLLGAFRAADEGGRA